MTASFVGQPHASSPSKAGQSWPHLMELVYRGDGKTPFSRHQSPMRPAMPNCSYPMRSAAVFPKFLMLTCSLARSPNRWCAARDIIIGATAAGMGDNFPTPNGEEGLLSGVEIMANMLAALRRDDFIKLLPMAWVAGIVAAAFVVAATRLPPLATARCAGHVACLSLAAILAASAGIAVAAYLVSARRGFVGRVASLSFMGLAAATGDERFHGIGVAGARAGRRGEPLAPETEPCNRPGRQAKRGTRRCHRPYARPQAICGQIRSLTCPTRCS